MTTQPTTVNKEEMPPEIWASSYRGQWQVPKFKGTSSYACYTRSDIHLQAMEALRQAREALEKCREYQICDEIDRIVLPALQTINSLGR